MERGMLAKDFCAGKSQWHQHHESPQTTLCVHIKATDILKEFFFYIKCHVCV